MHHHAALITAITSLILFLAQGLVGRARGKYKINAPATTGHPDFERTFRAHQNTIEATVMFLPVLWLATTFGFEYAAMIAGYVWCAARVWYLFAYIQVGGNRTMGFVIAFFAFLALLGMSFWGIITMMVG